MSTPLPDGMTLAAEVSGPRRRRLTWSRVARCSVPDGLILPMVLGTLIALLLLKLSSWVRVVLTAGLVLVWSVPVVVAVQVWYWMTNFQNGVVNYVLTQLHLGDFFHHDWYGTTFSQLGMVTALIVWGALPFVVVTVYAALAQVPRELVEAAEIDGANSLRV